MVTVVIPARNERFLQNTIDDLLKNARGEIEIIAILDGYWPDPIIKSDERVILIHRSTPLGMRNGITSAVKIAKGDYIMKIDAHCMVDEGFDLKLVESCKDNWIVIPRRKRLDAENWLIQDVGKPDIDYEYLSYPDNPGDFGGPGLNGRVWTQRIRERADNPEYEIDEAPASQGSSWFMKKDYFNFLELMDEKSYGPFWCESQELAFKSILSGGKYMVNKKTWYAHLHKGSKYGRGYSMSNQWLLMGRNQTMRYFAGEKVWHKQKYPLSYLIEQFMPMPGWTDEALAELKEREKQHWS